MPNWVYTTMTVTGQAQSIARFREKAAKPYTTRHTGVFDKNGEYDADAINVVEQKQPLSFWNFVEPEDKDAYFADKVRDDGHDEMTFAERIEHDLKFSNNWYDWNCRNWGTKWDACDCRIVEDAQFALTYRFDTAWAPAEPAFRAMVEQHPDLKFEFHNEEEQGWGVIFRGENGELEAVDSWDIPDDEDAPTDSDLVR